MVSKVGLSENKQVLAYNQFPLCYGNSTTSAIEAMAAQLSIIKSMNFNAVLTNPMQEFANVDVRKHSKIYSGSLYATASFKRFNEKLFSTGENLNPSQEQCENQLKAYTSTAHSEDLAPIFDLVLNHIGNSEQAKKELIGDLLAEINYEGNFVQYTTKKGKDIKLPLPDSFASNLGAYLENFLFVKGKSTSFPDTVKFNYSDGMIRRLMMDLIWQPFISRYIHNYGFTGVRIDAIKHIHEEILREVTAYIKQECFEAHKVNAIILGEYIGDATDAERNRKNITQLIEAKANFTHIYDSLYYKSYFSHSMLSRDKDKFHQDESAYLSFLRKIANSEQGGTFAFTGNHDFGDSYAGLWHVIGKSPNERQLKERLWAIALTQHAGYYLFCGDEYGVYREEAYYGILVFSNQYKEQYPYVSEKESPNNWNGEFNFCAVIREINSVIKRFLAPSPELFVFHYYDKNNKINIVSRLKEEGNWQSAVICCLDLGRKSSLNPDNSLEILNNLASSFGKTTEFLKENQAEFYFIQNDRAYVYDYEEDAFTAVNPANLSSLSATA